MNAPTFGKHYPLATYLAQRVHYDSRPRNEDGSADFVSTAYKAWSAEYRTHCDRAEEAIQAFLLELRASRQLSLVPDMYRRTHGLALAWNAFARGKHQPHHLERIAHSLNYALFVCSAVRTPKDATIEQAWNELVAAAAAGTFDWCHLDTQEECVTTGERVHFELNKWTPRLGTVDHKSRARDLMPLKPIPQPVVAHHVIQVPSGELLIADWPRIKAFTTATQDPAAATYEYSINNDTGKLRMSAWYAEQHGFMSVFVGNTLPQVLERNDHFIVARVDEDGELGQPPAEGRFAGSVCTDLWWATAIDRQVLTGILARTMPQEEAQQAVVELLADPFSTFMTLKVPAGVLHVYHTANEGDMQGFHSPDVPGSSVEQLYAVVSQRELTWSPKVQVAAIEPIADGETPASAEPVLRRPRP